MGKGSKQRPMQISRSIFDLRYELIQKETSKERKSEILKILQEIKESKNN